VPVVVHQPDHDGTMITSWLLTEGPPRGGPHMITRHERRPPATNASEAERR
jgi:hypothetical protein